MNSAREVSVFRSQGPKGLEAWIAAHGAAASMELDAVCKQKDAHTALLYWFTELPAAVAEAKRTGKPILSLRLLGNLDEEMSCANSRFFRKVLYCEEQVNAVLRDAFVLHWESVRPVPVVTIDFGGGKKLTQTLTGNSVHLVLDGAGRPVDALPGLMRAEAFVEKLEMARQLAAAPRKQLAALHARLKGLPQPQPFAMPPGSPQPQPFAMPPGSPQPQPFAAMPPGSPPPMMPPPASGGSRAFRASAIAMSKHVVEAPILRNVQSPLDQDTEQNHALHGRVREAFAEGAEWAGLTGFIEWIYAELFQMPLGDPALGLDVPDPFTTLEMPAAPPSAVAAAFATAPRPQPRIAHGTPVPRPIAAAPTAATGSSVGQPTLRPRGAVPIAPSSAAAVAAGASSTALPPPQPVSGRVRRFASTIARAISS